MPQVSPVILFDLDGTLADTAPDLAATLNVVLAELGVEPIAVDDVRHMVGHGARRLIERRFEADGQRLDAAELDRLTARFIAHYSDNIAVGSRPFPGVETALGALKRGGSRLAVCTNKMEALAVKLLRALDLDAHFDVIAGGDTFPVCKPDPGHLLLAVERAGGDPACAVMVGDSETDIRAARAAGIPFIGVTFGYTPTPIETFKPDALIDHFDALIPALRPFLGRLDGPPEADGSA
ncbi:MAG: phosphoglycolate phosphatase [Hyphomicrobiales bacterium]|nr:phosphoglycolate phosphatase [Hyphomicrobiales bacterium]